MQENLPVKEASTPVVLHMSDKLVTPDTPGETGVENTVDVGPGSSDTVITGDADMQSLQNVSEITLPSDTVPAEEQRVIMAIVLLPI